MPKGHEKDTSRTSPTSSGENTSVSKDLSNALAVLDSSVLTNPFGANITGENAYRRAERICAALHLITNHVPEDEPIRKRLRSGGIELLGHILELRSSFRTPASEKEQVVLTSIRELISVIRLLAIAGYASVQNVQAISEALDELGNLVIVSQRSNLSEQLSLTRTELTPPAQHAPSPGDMSSHKAQAAVKRTYPIKDKQTGEEKRDNSGTARSEHIMDMLKLGGVLGIRDIAANLPQYSEKMIQRELAELVRLNRVSKSGAKRWSRYKVVQ